MSLLAQLSSKRKVPDSIPIIQPLVLLLYQIPHKDRINDIFTKFPFAIDLSMLGTGKTYTTCFLFQEMHRLRQNQRQKNHSSRTRIQGRY